MRFFIDTAKVEDIKKANEFNCFVPFTQKGFVAIMKMYLGAENELSIDNGIFQVTKVKEELTVNAETKEEMNFTFEEIDDTLINGRFNMYQNVSLAEFNEDKNERDMSKEIQNWIENSLEIEALISELELELEN